MNFQGRTIIKLLFFFPFPWGGGLEGDQGTEATPLLRIRMGGVWVCVGFVFLFGCVG